MDVNQAKEARRLLDDLDTLNDFQEVIEKEDNHWWGFITPNVKRFNSEGMMMPAILREEFTEAVNRAIEKTTKKLDEL